MSEDKRQELTLCRGDSEWSALYVDGQLVCVGDHYLSDEKIFELAGVEMIYSEDFMRGGSTQRDVAPTLDEMNAYRKRREAREAEAEGLEVRARRLLEMAEDLRIGKEG